MTTVKLRPGESQASLLKRFRKEVGKARILSAVRKKRWFMSKSELRRKKRSRASEGLSESSHEREGDNDGKDQDSRSSLLIVALLEIGCQLMRRKRGQEVHDRARKA